MLRRIYIVDELLLARGGERHRHVAGRGGTPMEGLPEARVAQSSDLVPAEAELEGIDPNIPIFP